MYLQVDIIESNIQSIPVTSKDTFLTGLSVLLRYHENSIKPGALFMSSVGVIR